jgi:3-deoxy-D-manno-octulosonate 8-phosphate phosphatase (KDO 8-P phosphatase)
MNPFDSIETGEAGDPASMGPPSSSRRPGPDGPDLGRIRLLVLDFDGVLTDNRVLVSQDGTEAVWCHRGDGWGIARLKERGAVTIMVISTEANRVVEARCRKLGLDFIQACDDKLAALRRVAEQMGLGADQVAYVGNDVNDLECLRWVGTPIVVADAEPEVHEIARLVTARRGGYGAVREVADWLIAAHDRRPASGRGDV